MISLLIETSTEKGVVALFNENSLIYQGKLETGLQNSQTLFPEIEKAFADLKLKPSDLKMIIVGIGPGSYTGIRVAAMTAKALAFALNIPLIGVCSLEGFIPEVDGSFASLIDARIGGVYLQTGLMVKGVVQDLSAPELYPIEKAIDLLRETKMLVTPSCALLKPKLERLAPDINWTWIESDPSAFQLGESGFKKYKNHEFRNDQQLDLLYLRKTQAEIESKC